MTWTARTGRWVAAVALGWALATPVSAGDAPPAGEPTGRLALATERVVVFKDGYALFVKRGQAVADEQGRVFADAPDAAVLGCVWATTEERKALGMLSAWDERKEVRTRKGPCLTTLELLRANVGRDVSLGLTREGAANVNGKVREVLESDTPPPEGSPPPPSGPAGTTVREVPRVGGQIVVVDTDGGSRLAIPVAEVRTVAGKDLETSITRAQEVVTKSKRLTIDLGRDAAGKPAVVRLLYFAEGMRWIPTYRVGGGLVTDADIALQGEVLNEAEPLEGTALDLVVGVPSFRFKDVASPLTLEAALRGALRQAAPQLAQQWASNRMWSNEEQRMAEGGGAGTGMSTAPELATEALQDLFVYGVGKVTMAKGARATFPLWQSTAPLRHLYTMDVQVVRNFQSGEHAYRSAKQAWAPSETRPQPDRDGSSSPVWHELELSNGSEVPWTTGAALLLKGDVPLGQDVLTYTSAGAKTLLPMTVAVDLRGTWEEQEIERKSNALSWSGQTYSLVRKQGTVKLTNRRKEPSTVRVTVSVGGRAESATQGGKVTVNDLRADDWTGGAYAVNNHSDVVWEMVLAPGETKSLDVVFSFYVR